MFQSHLLVCIWQFVSVRARRSGGPCGSLVLNRSDAEDAERIVAVILLDDVSECDCIVDGTQCDENYVNGEKVTGVCRSAVDVTDSLLLSVARTRRNGGKANTFCTHSCRWQNALTKLPAVFGGARIVTTPFETWKHLITD